MSDGAPAAERWSPALAHALRDRAAPLLHAEGRATSRADTWRASRAWAARFDAHGLVPGDRVVCALAPGATLVAVLVAALERGLTLVPLPPGVDPRAALDAADARLAIATPDVVIAGGATRGPATPAVRLILHTSGSTGVRRGIALSDANVWAVLDSHRDALALDGATLLSVLPWHHVFGLVLELLPALLGDAVLARDPSHGRDVASLVSTAARHGATHLHAVPLTVRRLADAAGGRALLAELRGGLVGGAPVDAALAGLLATTRLRVGYGQTEASPGIALGAPGEWRAGLLGRPVGCDVRIEDDGELAFRGPNACVGAWRDGALHVLAPEAWRRTGDLARVDDDGSLVFVGRRADRFKLANGRFVDAAAIEGAVRARFAHVAAAMLSPTPDGAGLRLALTCDGVPPTLAALAPALGALASLPCEIVEVHAAAWVRTGKGELDRRFPTGAPATA